MPPVSELVPGPAQRFPRRPCSRRVEYGLSLAAIASAEVQLQRSIRSILVLDSGHVRALARNLRGETYPTYDFWELTRALRFWRDEWQVT